MPPAAAAALYLHVPFCSSTCPYCDFNSVTVRGRTEAYVNALCAEVRTAARRAGTLTSVYVGGGTPSLLTPGQFTRVAQAVHEAYDLAPECEWTIEANPGSVSRAKAEAWAEAGVTRVSVGAQSFDPQVLRTLDRRHTPEAVGDAVALVRAAGITNCSVDLMYGVPGQSLDAVRSSVQAAIAQEPAHVSAYVLTVEKGTPFGAACVAGLLHLPDDEAVLLQRDALEMALEGAGLLRYEISNYARPGFESRHNMAYWEHQPYVGCGAGAVDFDGTTRTRNLAAVDAYIGAVTASGTGAGSHETLDADTLMFEQLMNGLRLRRGMDDERFAARFGRRLAAAYPRAVRELEAGGFLEEADGRWRLTPRGVPVANEVTLRFMR